MKTKGKQQPYRFVCPAGTCKIDYNNRSRRPRTLLLIVFLLAKEKHAVINRPTKWLFTQNYCRVPSRIDVLLRIIIISITLAISRAKVCRQTCWYCTILPKLQKDRKTVSWRIEFTLCRLQFKSKRWAMLLKAKPYRTLRELPLC